MFLVIAPRLHKLITRPRSPLRASCLAFVAVVSLSAVSTDSGAVEATGYLVVTTDYVHRGVTQSDGHAAVQLGADLSFDSGFYMGAWASTVDIDNGPTRHRDTEISYFAGYGRGISDQWLLGGNVVAYTYPGTEGDVDYDYVEYSVVANYDDRFWIEYAYSPDLYDTGEHTHNLDLYAEWPLPAELILGAGAGFYDVSRPSGDDYTYWQLGLTRDLGRFSIDLRYHDTNRYVPVVSTPDRAKQRLVLSLRLVF